ncbi:helix-turn-helix domain-containing protein [Acinetobacter vivianii]
MSLSDQIQPTDIPANIFDEPQSFIDVSASQPTERNLKRQVEAFEYGIIAKALTEFKTTQKAAQALGIDQSTLFKKRQRYMENL